jgi:hypothetical protein
MIVHEMVAVVVGLLILAGVTTVVVNGGKSAQVLNVGFQGLATDIKAATLIG